MPISTLTSVTAVMKDLYPRAGDRIKQWVVDDRRENAWERATCPRVKVPAHLDNTEVECRNSGTAALWIDLNHDCCYTCGDRYEEASTRDDVEAWIEVRGERPPICADRTLLSDEIAPDPSMGNHPLLAMLKRKGGT